MLTKRSPSGTERARIAEEAIFRFCSHKMWWATSEGSTSRFEPRWWKTEKLESGINHAVPIRDRPDAEEIRPTSRESGLIGLTGVASATIERRN